MKNNFGEFLAQKRKENKLTQKQLSQKLFISESAVSKWEKNVSNPDISMLPKLSQILNVSEHELITASVDEEQKTVSKYAKKWQTFVSVWDLFFYISYGIALFTCFIVNLATEGTLSWFWLVLCSIIFAASFTTFPKFIKKYKLLIIPLLELALLLLLLGVCCLYTNGNWFWLASAPIVVGFLIIFLPIYFSHYNLPLWIKNNNSIICLCLDSILLLLMLLIINDFTNGNWFVNLALPLFAYTFLIALAMVIIGNYLKVNKLLKASFNLFAWLLFLIFLIPISNYVLFNALNIISITIQFPNFLDWNADIIQTNVMALILITLFILALIFLITGIIKYAHQKRKK